jgi:hypothetical protein
MTSIMSVPRVVRKSIYEREFREGRDGNRLQAEIDRHISRGGRIRDRQSECGKDVDGVLLKTIH